MVKQRPFCQFKAKVKQVDRIFLNQEELQAIADKKPQFIIISGPNGAGKSIFGRLHVPEGTPIFNGDLVFAELIRQHPHIDADRHYMQSQYPVWFLIESFEYGFIVTNVIHLYDFYHRRFAAKHQDLTNQPIKPKNYENANIRCLFVNNYVFMQPIRQKSGVRISS